MNFYYKNLVYGGWVIILDRLIIELEEEHAKNLWNIMETKKSRRLPTLI